MLAILIGVITFKRTAILEEGTAPVSKGVNSPADALKAQTCNHRAEPVQECSTKWVNSKKWMFPNLCFFPVEERRCSLETKQGALAPRLED